MPTAIDTIDNTADVIDSRDIIERIEALESWFEEDRETASGYLGLRPGVDATDEQTTEHINGPEQSLLDADELKELGLLKEFVSQAEGYTADLKDGVCFVRDSYFQDYAREFAADIGAIEDDARWPHSCIDWSQAAAELQQDYTSIEFDGVTYWGR